LFKSLSPMLSGSAAAIGAFTLWGVMPIYFKALGCLPAAEILCHRIIWSAALTVLLVCSLGKVKSLWFTIRQIRQLTLLALSASLVGANWLLFIWSVNNDRMVDASLGYFINPLINMVLGYLFFNERLVLLQKIAAGLAVTGVMIQVIGFGQIPWIALGLGFSFACYGLIRKRISVDSLTGLNIETTLLLPVAITTLFLSVSPTSNLFNNNTELNILLMAAGPATTLPLLLFVFASKRLTLTSLGFYQYIGPSLMFILAISVYKENVGADRWLTFILIWTALALVSWHAVSHYRQQTKARSG
jgi:chloramphenicol-sensitive protein RarD